MIELFLRIGFAVAAAIAAIAAVLWALVILPEWWRLRRERKAKSK